MTRMEVAEKLKMYRLSVVVEGTGIFPSTLRRIAKGKNCNTDTLEKLIDFFNRIEKRR